MNVYDWAKRHGCGAGPLGELLDIIDPSRTTIAGNVGSSEGDIQARLRVAAPKHGSSLWRNNNGATFDKDGRMIRFGLGNDSKKLAERWKSSDLIGITPCTSTSAGQTFGVFTAVEVKKPGWSAPTNDRERAQANFLSTVQTMGGIAMFAQSVEDYERMFL